MAQNSMQPQSREGGAKCLVMPEDFRRHWEGKTAPDEPPRPEPDPARGARVGTTFGEFVEACKRLGIRDNDTLGSIEYGTAQICSGRIVKDDGENGIEIREVRR